MEIHCMVTIKIVTSITGNVRSVNRKQFREEEIN